MIVISYPKERWEEIPEQIRWLDTTELDFTDHEERELHKMEMDRRMWLSNIFLQQYTWSGIRRSESGKEDKRGKSSRQKEKKEEKSDPQSNLEAFVQNA